MMTSYESNIILAFLPDDPIKEHDQDRLNRTNFIRVLADQLRKFDQPEFLVIGIHGPWGSGKSSFMNLLANELEK
jgi:predicted KAP-like P-loop ATPase